MPRNLSLIVGLICAAAAPAADLELRAVLGQVETLKAADPGRAEGLLEGLARVRPDDPRAWFHLAELRLALGSKRSATYAYHRAAGLASPARREKIAARLIAAGLPPAPARDEVDSADEFLDRARAAACQVAADQGRVSPELGCPADAGEGPAVPAFRVTPRVVKALAKEPQAWVREALAARAPLALFGGGYLRVLLGDTDSGVRLQAYRRLEAAAGEVELSKAAFQALEAGQDDDDLEVRLAAVAFVFRHGYRPAVRPGDLGILLARAERGRVSKTLTRQVFAERPDVYLPLLEAVVVTPGVPGKTAAVMLMGLDCGPEGRRALAKAFVVHGPALGGLRGHAFQALTAGTRGEGVTIGTDPSTWLAALGG